MKTAFILLFLLLPAAAQQKHPAQLSKSLGHGYRLVNRTVSNEGCQNCFEAFAQYHDLYYRSKLLTESVDFYDISPSGQFAIYGRPLRLFNRKTNSIEFIAVGIRILPADVQWHEKKKIAVIEDSQDEERNFTINLK